MNGVNPQFEEAAYLKANPDVAEAVTKGLIHSGFVHYEKFGRAEGRSLCLSSKTASRNAKIMSLLKNDGIGLEVGPSHNPIAPKKLGYKTEIVDHLDKAGLIDKYSGHVGLGVNIENIEEVDFIWKGEPLSELIGKTQHYDWIIASHVIEHVPDLLTFLQQCENLLKPEGALSLVIPDKRYCFDHLKSSSSTGEVLDAFESKRVCPSPGQVFDHFANACKKNGKIAWDDSTAGDFEFVHSFDQARNLYHVARTTNTYIDTHCWRFTPASFRLVIKDLVMLGFIEFEILSESPTEGSEFYVILTRVDRSQKVRHSDEDRLMDLQVRKSSEV
jgi:predicted SAM-dependent methyltransferase